MRIKSAQLLLSVQLNTLNLHYSSLESRSNMDYSGDKLASQPTILWTRNIINNFVNNVLFVCLYSMFIHKRVCYHFACVYTWKGESRMRQENILTDWARQTTPLLGNTTILGLNSSNYSNNTNFLINALSKVSLETKNLNRGGTHYLQKLSDIIIL